MLVGVGEIRVALIYQWEIFVSVIGLFVNYLLLKQIYID